MLILKQLRRKKKLSQTDLANTIGVSLRTIQLYEKKDANIPIKNLTKIAEYFNLSIAEMYMHEVNEESGIYLNSMALNNKGNRVYDIDHGKYFVIVPLVTQNGYKRYIELLHESDDNLSALPKVGFILNYVGDKKYVAFEILGDSMNDGSLRAIPNNAIVLGEKAELNKINFKEDDSYKGSKVVVCNDRILCKEIVGFEEKTNQLVCHSLNSAPEYADFELPLSEVLGIYDVVKKQL